MLLSKASAFFRGYTVLPPRGFLGGKFKRQARERVLRAPQPLAPRGQLPCMETQARLSRRKFPLFAGLVLLARWQNLTSLLSSGSRSFMQGPRLGLAVRLFKLAHEKCYCGKNAIYPAKVAFKLEHHCPTTGARTVTALPQSSRSQCPRWAKAGFRCAADTVNKATCRCDRLNICCCLACSYRDSFPSSISHSLGLSRPNRWSAKLGLSDSRLSILLRRLRQFTET